ncbi:hypothetical protein BV25DRAFT_1917026 [Artomyces pyxidatus]|uniref:Uncharacterized protein n=1 Tax=Artomyces pyxidatus TaxID=48021 RepID=A0ACB8SZR2_9AGAM|nr:hypothetical protein BV25DRAFT_1917026 [Artomyces pyxidatus]
MFSSAKAPRNTFRSRALTAVALRTLPTLFEASETDDLPPRDHPPSEANDASHPTGRPTFPLQPPTMGGEPGIHDSPSNVPPRIHANLSPTATSMLPSMEALFELPQILLTEQSARELLALSRAVLDETRTCLRRAELVDWQTQLQKQLWGDEHVAAAAALKEARDAANTLLNMIVSSGHGRILKEPRMIEIVAQLNRATAHQRRVERSRALHS